MLATAARGLGFVVVHTAIVTAYVAGLARALPPLRDEAELFVVPAAAIAAAAFAGMYPLLRAVRTHLARLAIFGAIASVALVAYPLVFLASIPPPPSPLALVLFAIACELLYGAPMLVVLLVVAKATSPVLVARPATSWA